MDKAAWPWVTVGRGNSQAWATSKEGAKEINFLFSLLSLPPNPPGALGDGSHLGQGAGVGSGIRIWTGKGKVPCTAQETPAVLGRPCLSTGLPAPLPPPPLSPASHLGEEVAGIQAQEMSEEEVRASPRQQGRQLSSDRLTPGESRKEVGRGVLTV